MPLPLLSVTVRPPGPVITCATVVRCPLASIVPPPASPGPFRVIGPVVATLKLPRSFSSPLLKVRFVRFELPVRFQTAPVCRVTLAVLAESVVIAPVNCDAAAVKVVTPDDRVFSSTPLLLATDDPLTAISAIAPSTWKASAAEFTIALVIWSTLGNAGSGDQRKVGE